MEKNQIIAFLNAVNAMEPYVPPILFKTVAQSDVCRMLVSAANGLATCEYRPSEKQEDMAAHQDIMKIVREAKK